MRILLFVTTHLSPTHKQFLSTCWRQMPVQPFFQNADVILLLGRSHMARASDLESLSQFSKARVTSGVKGLLPWAGGQGPATAAMHDPHACLAYGGGTIDWPPNVDAVLGSCSTPSTNPLDRHVISDFFPLET